MSRQSCNEIPGLLSLSGTLSKDASNQPLILYPKNLQKPKLNPKFNQISGDTLLPVHVIP